MKKQMYSKVVLAPVVVLGLLAAVVQSAFAGEGKAFQNRYARIRMDGKGVITSIVAIPSGKEYSPAGHPSPLLSLHESGQPNDKLVAPVSASFHSWRSEIRLVYPGGMKAVVKVAEKRGYFRFQLVSLEPRGTVDNIVWGPVNTTISKFLGDIIGVVRDDAWAIGLYGIDDNTIAGPVEDGDCYGMGYIIHSPDPVKCPLPEKYKEGQMSNLGGDGVCDWDFYSHPEEYFQQLFGSGAKLRPEFGSSIAYHSRDRRKSYVHKFSLLPFFQRSLPRTMISDPIEGVDFIGSTVAFYACPDDEGLKTIETIIKTEGLPYITIDGKWVRDPAGARPTVYWNGPVDKCIEYTQAMGFKDISRDTGCFYPSLNNTNWQGRVGFSGGKSLSYKEFAEEAHRHGLTHGGLHTLCVFLQHGVSSDVTPVPSEHLQTVCRTKLAKDISPTDTEIEVTDPSVLAERGTWTAGDGSNCLRIGGELLRYDGISEKAPYLLKGVTRGFASKALAHKAGDEIVKLMLNCYSGFAPDMKLMLDYAEYCAKLMVDNGMDTINFDGYESLMYQNHGYYAMKLFNRRLFETYAKLTGGRYPRVTGSSVFSGAWEFMNVCDVGGGNNMFNSFSGRRGIEGKDIGNGYSRSYFPGTFGIQDWFANWSRYDAQNLMAKAVGWEATFALSTSRDAIDRTGDRDEIFTAFRAWQNARAAQVFSKAQKASLRDPDYKFHLEQTGRQSFTLYPVKEIKVAESAGGEAKHVVVANPCAVQPLEFALQVSGPVNGCVITLPDGAQIKTDTKLVNGQFIICRGNHAYLADNCRKKTGDLSLASPAVLPAGESKISVQFPGGAQVRFELTVWASGKGEVVGK